jgi:large subunit ribosomal protein L3
MARSHKPVAGSRAYWPRKRARRIYPRLGNPSPTASPGPAGFAGYKAGMTRVVYVDNTKGSATEGQEIVRAATVLECPSLVVCAIRTCMRTPYGLKNLHTIWAGNLSKDLDRRLKIPHKTDPASEIKPVDEQAGKLSDVRLIVHTTPRKTAMGKKKPEVFEVRLGGDDVAAKWQYAKDNLGKEIRASDVLKEGDWIDVRAVTTGQGWMGPVRRFGVKVRPRKHEQKRRHGGVLGARGVARVLPGKIAMAGQHGFQTRTEYNKRVLKIGSGDLSPEGGWVGYGLVRGDYLVVEGSVPGPRKRLVMLRKGLRWPKHKKEASEVKHVFLESQQGKYST